MLPLALRALSLLTLWLICVTPASAGSLAAPIPTFRQVPRPADQLGAGARGFASPTCVSPELCFVLGRVGNTAILDRFNGEGLRAGSIGPVRYGARSLSCPTATFCMTVGVEGDGYGRPASAVITNGRWRTVAMPEPPTRRRPVADHVRSDVVHWQPEALSCASSRSCVAVGDGFSGGPDRVYDLALIERWNGQRWFVEKPGDTRGGLKSVSCPTSGTCMAVGFSDGAPAPWSSNNEILRAGRWQASATGAVPGAQLAGYNSVSCASVRRCVAVGVAVGGRSSTESLPHDQGLTATWSGGGWTPQTQPLVSGSAGESLSDVSCPSAPDAACTAIGTWGDRYAYPGGTVVGHIMTRQFLQAKRPLPAFGSGTTLACPSPTFCLGVGSVFVYRTRAGSGG